MPAVSASQRRAAAAALSAKRGGRPTSSLLGPSRAMSKMTEKQLRDFARKPRTTSQVAGLHSPRKAKRTKTRRKR